jgi:VWFA-related protein
MRKPTHSSPDPSRRAFVAGLLAASGHLLGQDATFKTEVKVVDVLASVRAKNGALITDLSQQDFTILENGRPQTIRYFAKQSDLPLTIGLMVDTSMSQARVMEAERSASFRFLDAMLREDKDQVFLMQFDMSVMLRQELTSSRRKLNEVLPFIDTPTRADLSMPASGGTLLFDAILKASTEIMTTRQGRKALIVLSDGGENGSDSTLQAAIDATLKADTLIYAIFYYDPRFYFGGDGYGRRVMQRLAKETGGGFYEVSKKLNIDQVYAIIEEELRSQYNLGYVSDVPVRISEFRKIQTIVDRKGLTVQARDRYWARR